MRIARSMARAVSSSSIGYGIDMCGSSKVSSVMTTGRTRVGFSTLRRCDDLRLPGGRRCPVLGGCGCGLGGAGFARARRGRRLLHRDLPGALDRGLVLDIRCRLVCALASGHGAGISTFTIGVCGRLNRVRPETNAIDPCRRP